MSATQVSHHGFAITTADDGRSINFAQDNDLTVVLKNGGDESAQFDEAGIVVVLLGIAGIFDYLKVEPGRAQAARTVASCVVIMLRPILYTVNYRRNGRQNSPK
jgi:archaellum component FlaG (FlaF/FlaG flagellin family)